MATTNPGTPAERKLRIFLDLSALYRDFPLPADWDDLDEHEQYRLVREYGERAADELLTVTEEVVDLGGRFTVTLDETRRWAVARLLPGQSLTVTAPPCTAEIIGRETLPWMVATFDEFGVRPSFTRSSALVAAHLLGPLATQLNAACAAIEANPAQTPVARIVFEKRGTVRKPTWHATGHDLLAGSAS